MTEQDLRDLGFKQNVVLPEESGCDTPFWFYTYDFDGISSLGLISSDNGEAEKNGWYVEIFDSSMIRFTDVNNLTQFISILERNIKR